MLFIFHSLILVVSLPFFHIYDKKFSFFVEIVIFLSFFLFIVYIYDYIVMGGSCVCSNECDQWNVVCSLVLWLIRSIVSSIIFGSGFSPNTHTHTHSDKYKCLIIITNIYMEFCICVYLDRKIRNNYGSTKKNFQWNWIFFLFDCSSSHSKTLKWKLFCFSFLVIVLIILMMMIIIGWCLYWCWSFVRQFAI